MKDLRRTAQYFRGFDGSTLTLGLCPVLVVRRNLFEIKIDNGSFPEKRSRQALAGPGENPVEAF